MRKYFAVALVVLAVAAFSGPAYSRSIAIAPPPEETLRAASFNTDPESLIRYLENGIPPDHVAPPSDNAQEQPFVLRRFGFYGTMISVLANARISSAVPLLRTLQAGEFPFVMEADLAVYVAAQQDPGHDYTWEDWDQAAHYHRDWFRMGCALAIAKITGESPIRFLEELLGTWTTPVMEEYRRNHENHNLRQFYIAICRALTVHGAKTGIDALVAILDGPSGERFSAVSLLQQWTAQNFGPHYDDSTKTKAVEIEKWKTWWAAHRDTFVANVASIESPTTRHWPNPEPTTLRDRVWHIVEGRGDFDGLYSSRAATEWLETNGARESRALRKIVEDEDERMAIRAEALKWYVKFERNPSYKMLLDYAKQPSDPYYNALAFQARALIKERFPEHYVEVNTILLEAYPGDASFAVTALTETPEGRAFLVKHFSSLRNEPQFQAIQFVARQPNPPVSVLGEALLSDDSTVAAFAALGIEKSDSELQLSAAARLALNEWRKNPEFLMYRINFDDDYSTTLHDFEMVFAAIDVYDPHAAEIFVRTRKSLQSRERHNPDLQADPAGVARLKDDAVRGCLRCVEAYRTSRGQAAPLPNYSF